MKKTIIEYWEAQPLTLVLILGIFFRMLAVVFSQGYGMHDDHFLVIEIAQCWADGHDYYNWLPKNRVDAIPTGHSYFYVGLHYIFFSFLKMIGITGPLLKMFIVRLIHAAYSLLVIYFGCKLADKIGGKVVARNVGLLLAIFWFMPFLSVRNLIEIVCIPPLLWMTYILYNNKDNSKWLPYLYGGILAGIAIGIRFQCVVFIGGVGLVLLFERRWIGAMVFGVITATSFFITQIADIFLWGYPFAELSGYINYNIDNAYTYLTQGWEVYILLLLGVLIPPISIFLFAGFFKKWRTELLVFLPSFIFLVFHTVFPNKQERFILPILPFIVILGYAGWYELNKQVKWGILRESVIRKCWTFFWVINTILLVVVSVSSSKINGVEAMTYLSKKNDFRNLVVECTHRSNYFMVPLYYLDNQDWERYIITHKEKPVKVVRKIIDTQQDAFKANYVIFVEDTDLENRIEEFKKEVSDIEFEITILPGFLDRFMFFLNPRNDNINLHIYRFKEG